MKRRASKFQAMADEAAVGLFNLSARMAHDPKALKQIGPKERHLLGLIAIRLAVIGHKTLGEFMDAKDGSGHYLYDETAWVDLATVEFTICELGAKEFYAPLMGGTRFLEHILECEHCLFLLSSNDDMPAEAIRVFETSLNIQLQRWGFARRIDEVAKSITNRGFGSFLDFFRGQ